MHRSFAIITSALLVLAGARAQAPLTNADIVKMVKSGTGDDSILNSIEQQSSEFSTDVTSLIDMKNAGVDERVLIGIVRKGPAPEDPLDPQAVIRLHRVGFSDDFLAVVLQQQPGRFDASAEGVAALKKAGLSDRIVGLVVPGSVPAPAGASVNGPNSGPDSGPEPSVSPGATAPPVPPQGRELPTGTKVSVRIIDSIDSEKNREGDRFRATLEDPVRIGDDVVIPRGTDARVRLIADQSAGKLSGRTELTLRLDDIKINGQTVTVNTSAVTESSKSQGSSTAKKAVAGGALGALIGALAGGGKGAAIGAGAGAAAGAGSGVFMKGPRVKVPSETILTFTTEGSIRLP